MRPNIEIWQVAWQFLLLRLLHLTIHQFFLGAGHLELLPRHQWLRGGERVHRRTRLEIGLWSETRTGVQHLKRLHHLRPLHWCLSRVSERVKALIIYAVLHIFLRLHLIHRKLKGILNWRVHAHPLVQRSVLESHVVSHFIEIVLNNS